MKSREGYLYITTGTNFIEEAIVSVKSLRKCKPDAHVTLITDTEANISDFDDIKVLEVDNSDSLGGKYFKVQCLLHSPYEKTFYVDTDTFFIEAADELFTLLNYHDFLIAHAPADVREVMIGKSHLHGYLPYNCGLIVYKRCKNIEKLFTEWHSICNRRIYSGDQPAFMEALLANNPKYYVLPQNYNLRLPFMNAVPGMSVKILHGRRRNLDIIAKKVNELKDYQRAWNPNQNDMEAVVEINWS